VIFPYIVALEGAATHEGTPPFAPESVLPTLDNFREKCGEMMSQYGISCSFNPTLSERFRQSWQLSG
jgi:hypothetical protein